MSHIFDLRRKETIFSFQYYILVWLRILSISQNPYENYKCGSSSCKVDIHRVWCLWQS